MGSYRVALTASAEKELRGLSAKMVARIMPRLEGLVTNPRPPGCKKLKGGDKEWRIRVGDYRIVYVIDDKAGIVDVTRIAHRRDVYEWAEGMVVGGTQTGEIFSENGRFHGKQIIASLK